MRVLVNKLTALRQKTGIGHYVTELLHSLRTQFEGDSVVTFPGPVIEVAAWAWGTFRKNSKRLQKRCFGAPAGGSAPQFASSRLNARARDWAARHFRMFWSGRSFDLYHEPNYIPFPCDRPTVATIHDLSVVLHPEWHPIDRVAHYERNFDPGLQRCAHLLTVSEFTRRELIENFRIAPDRVTCTPLGVRSDLRPLSHDALRPVLERLGLPKQYLLHVGTMEPRKNLLMLLRAYCDLPAPARERCPLVLAGGWGWNVAELADYYHGTARHLGVRHLGYVHDADLPAVYNGARALVFPSHYEGFGLPPLEMLACGGAVIASTAGAVAEVVGRQAHPVDAQDLPAWRQAMLRVIRDDDWHALLCRGAKASARVFTWERCARETFRVYGEVLGKKVKRLPSERESINRAAF